MIPSRIPPKLRQELRRRLGKGDRSLAQASFYERIAAKVAEYGKAITNAEAAFVLASQNGVDLRGYLDQKGRDRILDLVNKAPIVVRESKRRVSAEKAGSPVPAEPKTPACQGRPKDAFDCIGLHPQVVETCRKLFRQGNYALAVEEGVKLFNNSVKERLGRPQKSNGREYDGDNLMDYAFSNSSGMPKLTINDHRTESKRNEQTGYHHLAKGAMIGLRNPRAHGHQVQDEPDLALEMISLISYLMKKLDTAVRTRRRKKS